MKRNEQAIFDAIIGSKDPTTMEIVAKSGLSKATTLKYLQRLRNAGIVDYRTIGPSKIWEPSDTTTKGPTPGKSRPNIGDIIRDFEDLTGSKANIIIETDGLAITARLSKVTDNIGQTTHRLGEREAF